ncbi:Leukotriene A-4 hydrolase, partial [Trachymyrmex septentrionalis]
DIARVLHIHLDLFVDFDETVLRGKAILLIDMKRGYDEIVNIYQLNEDKMYVTDYKSGDHLEYSVTQNVDSVGSKFLIRIPQLYKGPFTEYKYQYCITPYKFNYNCIIQIEYETRKDSPALYWLRSDQTSDGTHPLLITNNTFIYARGILPCQDSPSVRFTFTAEISVPSNFNSVIICGRTSKQMIHDGDRHKFIFFEKFPVPSYAMIIMVGSLERILIYINLKRTVNLWIEKKYIEQSTTAFINFRHIFNIAKEYCGPLYNCTEYNICVLPPNIPEIELQCLTTIFVSSTLLNEDSFLICSTLAQKVAQSWTGGVVTCENFQHLWLNKSFSTFISRKIIHRMYEKNLICNQMSFLERKTINDLIIKISLLDIDSEQKLVPNLKNILPKDITKYVIDELGYILLNYLDYLLGSQYFKLYLKSYLYNFRFKSINTNVWMNYLCDFFDDKEILKSKLDKWFYGPNLSLISIEDLCTLYPELHLKMEVNQRYLLTKQWATTEEFNNFTYLLTKLKLYNNLERKEFLSDLYASNTVLPVAKLWWLHRVFPLDEQTCENRLLLLRLYIKNKWLEMIQPALKFAREYCSPTFACPIFRELYELEETRYLAISGFTAIVEKRCKMLSQTMEEVASILKINLKDIYVLTSEESTLHVKPDNDASNQEEIEMN